MAAQRRGELGGPLVGEEQACSGDLDDLGGAGDGVTQPVGPFAAEEDVAGAPDDEGRDPQPGQGDIFFRRKWAYWLRDAIPGATGVVEIDKGRLFFPDERAAELTAALRSHWEAHP